MTAVTVVVTDAAALRALYEGHLSKGRAFVAGEFDIQERAPCELVVLHGRRVHRLVAEVVHVRQEDPMRGVGLALAKLDERGAAALRAFVEDAEPVAAVAAGDEAPASEGSRAEDETEDGPQEIGAPSLHDRIRNLSGAEQLRLAAGGTLAERTALERMYGPTVWEPLLRNARLTIPEVARIARKGSLPRPLVEFVATNAAWLQSGEVQRALLSNPRSSPAVVMKVMGSMSRHDLQLVPQQSAYPESVRALAKKRLGR